MNRDVWYLRALRWLGQKFLAWGEPKAEETTMKFYCVQKKSSVTVPDKDCTKVKYNGANGRTTYAVKAVTKEGYKLTLFVSEDMWNKLPCKKG